MPKESANSRVVKKTPTRVVRKRAPRKAPTPLTQQSNIQKLLRKQILIGAGVFLVVFLGSIGIGIADAGRINVSSVIEERNVQIVAEGGKPIGRVTIPKQGQGEARKPDGGLRGAGDIEVPKPKPKPVSTSTATSTDDGTASSTATSTDETAGEGDEDSSEDENNETSEENSEEEVVEEISGAPSDDETEPTETSDEPSPE